MNICIDIDKRFEDFNAIVKQWELEKLRLQKLEILLPTEERHFVPDEDECNYRSKGLI